MSLGSENYSKTISTRIFELLAAKAHALLTKNKRDCLTYDDFAAQDLVERLFNPKDQFSKLLSDVFKAKYGQKLLDDLANEVKDCKFELAMTSKMTFKSEGSLLTLNASFTKLPMQLTFSKGDIFLWGGGDMQLSDAVSGLCSFPLNHYPQLKFVVEKLSPVFSDGLLSDFTMKYYWVHGWNKAVTVAVKERRDGCPSMIALSGGGDYWTGLFTLARIDDPIFGWQIKNDLKSGSSLTATWKSSQPSFVPLGVSGATATDDTTFVLKVTKNKK